MRPTYLQFRSPKERTEYNVVASTTNDGHCLFLKKLDEDEGNNMSPTHHYQQSRTKARQS